MILDDTEDFGLRIFSTLTGVTTVTFDALTIIGYFIGFKSYKMNKKYTIIIVSCFYALFHCLSVLTPVLDLWFTDKTVLCKAAAVIQILGMVHIMLQEPFMGVLLNILLSDKMKQHCCGSRSKSEITKMWQIICFCFQFGFQLVTIALVIATDCISVQPKKCFTSSGTAKGMSTYVMELFLYRIVEMASVVTSIVLNSMALVRVRQIKRNVAESLGHDPTVAQRRRDVMGMGMGSGAGVGVGVGMNASVGVNVGVGGGWNGKLLGTDNLVECAAIAPTYSTEGTQDILNTRYTRSTYGTGARRVILTSDELYLLKRFNISAFLALGLIVFNNMFVLYRRFALEGEMMGHGIVIWYGMSDGLFMVFRSGVVLVYSQRFLSNFFSRSERR